MRRVDQKTVQLANALGAKSDAAPYAGAWIKHLLESQFPSRALCGRVDRNLEERWATTQKVAPYAGAWIKLERLDHHLPWLHRALCGRVDRNLYC